MNEQEFSDSVQGALAHVGVRHAPGVRMVGGEQNNTLFKRSRSRPIERLHITPLQNYVWLLTNEAVRVSDLITLTCKRIPELDPMTVAWVVADLQRKGFIETLPAKACNAPSQ